MMPFNSNPSISEDLKVLWKSYDEVRDANEKHITNLNKQIEHLGKTLEAANSLIKKQKEAIAFMSQFPPFNHPVNYEKN